MFEHRHRLELTITANEASDIYADVARMRAGGAPGPAPWYLPLKLSVA